ncbi:GNAT family N-acetyltransferase [Clostridium sp. D33t1_170424_F3]|uniref:GNAT family N-acetyltransferase n=1 Tax=Clostridium sp. D33t1_170424_F3 TaxID=2787099 RepID=UPI0018A91301|nr:GNAT family N-acetyltransferase [Clostridium sp. D33t1_170424_F3]
MKNAIKLTYEPANAADAEAIFLLNKDQIDRYEDLQSIDYEKALTWVRQKITSHIGAYIRILYENQKAGYCYFHPVNGKMELDDLCILPAFQNRGIGTAVLLQCCSNTDLPIYLYVFTANIGAVALYTRLGFQIRNTFSSGRLLLQKDGSR